jgi:hypothetical protein
MFEPKSGHVGFVPDKVSLVQVFSEYFGFPCQFSFHRLLHIHHLLSSGAGTIGQTVIDIPSGLNFTAHQETKKENIAKQRNCCGFAAMRCTVQQGTYNIPVVKKC